MAGEQDHSRNALASRLIDHADGIDNIAAHDLEVDLRAAAKALQEAEQVPPATDDDDLTEKKQRVERRFLAASLAVQISHQDQEEALKTAAEVQNVVRFILGAPEAPRG